MVRAPQPSVQSALEAVPLPLKQTATPPDVSATLSMRTCSADDLQRRADSARAVGGPALRLPASQEMGVAADLLTGPDDQVVLVCDGQGLASVSADGRRAEVIVTEPVGLPAATLAASAVLALVAELGFSPIHASLADRDAAVMFCGERSRGKSSSCMALARAGWTVRADDRCFVHTPDDRILVWGPGGTVSLRSGAAELWPDLVDKMAGDRGAIGKHVVEAAAVGGRAEAGSVVCHALLFPEVVGDGPHRVERMPRAEALSEMLLTTGLALVPAHAALHFRHLTTLIEQTSCYRLMLGEDMDALPSAIAGVLE